MHVCPGFHGRLTQALRASSVLDRGLPGFSICDGRLEFRAVGDLTAFTCVAQVVLHCLDKFETPSQLLPKEARVLSCRRVSNFHLIYHAWSGRCEKLGRAPVGQLIASRCLAPILR